MAVVKITSGDQIYQTVVGEEYSIEVSAGDEITEPDDPVFSGGLFNPRDGAELELALQRAIDGAYVLQCDARARPVIEEPIVLNAHDRGTSRHGWQGNGMQLLGALGDPGQALVTFQLSNLQNRHLFVDNVAFDDRARDGFAPAEGLKLFGRRIVGENGLYSFQLNRLMFESCKDGLVIDGYVFEGVVDVPEATNCDRAIVLRMDANNVLSNVIIRTPLLRASRIGIECEYANSVMVTGSGSFIDIAERAIKASNGVKLIDGCDFENAGDGHAIDIASSDWRMTIANCTGSNTAGRMPHLIRYAGDPAALMNHNNRMNYQGQGTFTPDSTVATMDGS